MATKTLSIRINDENYKFISSLAKEERADVSTAVRELVDLGRIMLAVEKYKKKEASLERTARLAGELFLIKFSVKRGRTHEM